VHLEARLESGFNQTETADSAAIFARVEPSAIDSFVAELQQVELAHAGAATLRILDIS
jgi:DNA-directed RNA polymerase subunit F